MLQSSKMASLIPNHFFYVQLIYRKKYSVKHEALWQRETEKLQKMGSIIIFFYLVYQPNCTKTISWNIFKYFILTIKCTCTRHRQYIYIKFDKTWFVRCCLRILELLLHEVRARVLLVLPQFVHKLAVLHLTSHSCALILFDLKQIFVTVQSHDRWFFCLARFVNCQQFTACYLYLNQCAK